MTKPLNRDRGLHLVGMVTLAAVVASLVGIGATTALAAAQTRHDDASRATTTRSAPSGAGGGPRTVPRSGS